MRSRSRSPFPAGRIGGKKRNKAKGCRNACELNNSVFHRKGLLGKKKPYKYVPLVYSSLLPKSHGNGHRSALWEEGAPGNTSPTKRFLRPRAAARPTRQPPGASPPHLALVLFSNFNSLSGLEVLTDKESIFLCEVFASALEHLKKKKKKQKKNASHCNFRAGEVQNSKRPLPKANFLRLLSEEKCPRATRVGTSTWNRARKGLGGKEAGWGGLSTSQCPVRAVHSQDN